MILRNSQYPRGIDLGPARNQFHVGAGTKSRKYRVATLMYARSQQAKHRNPEYLAFIGAIARRAIEDAQAGGFGKEDLAQMVEWYREATGLGPFEGVILDDVADWLRNDAASWLRDNGISIYADARDVKDAEDALMLQLRKAPAA